MAASDGQYAVGVAQSSSSGLPSTEPTEGEPVVSDSTAHSTQELTFEQIMGALEAVTRKMSAPDVGIEEATDLYEEAEALHALATDRLARIQARIDSLAAPRRNS